MNNLSVETHILFVSSLFFGVTDLKKWSEPDEISIWVSIVACPLSLFITRVLDKIICSNIQNEAAIQVEFGGVSAPKQTVAVNNISAFTPGVKHVSVTALMSIQFTWKWRRLRVYTQTLLSLRFFLSLLLNWCCNILWFCCFSVCLLLDSSCSLGIYIYQLCNLLVSVSSPHQCLSKRNEVLTIRSTQHSLISFYPILIRVNYKYI